MKKQYIKPFMNVHTLKVETAILAASYRVNPTFNDMTANDGPNGESLTLETEQEKFGIDTKWEWGNGNNSGVD